MPKSLFKAQSSKGYNRNSGKRWRYDDVTALRQLARKGAPLRLISLRLGRPDAAIQSKADALNLSLNTSQVFVAPPPKRTLTPVATPDVKHLKRHEVYQGDLFV